MKKAFALARIVWIEMIRRKEFYVLLILLGAMLFVLLSIDIFGLGSTVLYVLDVGLSLAWICSIVLAVNLVGRQLPTEESRGTIYALLAKPITRWELVVGKWIGAWSSASLATLIFYGVLVAVFVTRGGRVDGGAIGQALLLHAVALGVVCGLALAVSTRLTEGAAATVSFILIAASLTLVPAIPELLATAAGVSEVALRVLYYILPHIELFDMRQRVVHGWGAVEWHIAAIVVLYGVVWTTILVILAWLGYRRKLFRRGGRA